jgi:hypothetical protein
MFGYVSANWSKVWFIGPQGLHHSAQKSKITRLEPETKVLNCSDEETSMDGMVIRNYYKIRNEQKN